MPTVCVYISHDVIFDELVFPFLEKSVHTDQPSQINNNLISLPNPLNWFFESELATTSN